MIFHQKWQFTLKNPCFEIPRNSPYMIRSWNIQFRIVENCLWKRSEVTCEWPTETMSMVFLRVVHGFSDLILDLCLRQLYREYKATFLYDTSCINSIFSRNKYEKIHQKEFLSKKWKLFIRVQYFRSHSLRIYKWSLWKGMIE